MKISKIVLLVIIAVLAFSSCKNVKDDIVGTWNFQTFDSRPQGYLTWSFKENGDLIRVLSSEGTLKIDSCKYTIDQSIFRTRINVEKSKSITGFTDINGVYRIDNFKNDILVMTRIKLQSGSSDGAFYRCEMIRKQ